MIGSTDSLSAPSAEILNPTEAVQDSVAPLILSILMCVGIFLSYLPQHLKIIQRKSSDGLSAWYQLLGALSMLCILENALMTSFRNINQCSTVSALECSTNVMVLLQVIVQSFCFMFMVSLFIWYFPLHRRYIPSASIRSRYSDTQSLIDNDDVSKHLSDGHDEMLDPHLLSNHKRELTAEYSRALNIGIVIFGFALVTFAVSSGLMIVSGDPAESELTSVWADILGGFSTSVALLQFIPQLVQTFYSGEVGALSIPAMLMQTPGSFILVYTLSNVPNAKLSTWITYVVTGVLQCCLLVMCIIFTIRDRRREKQELDVSGFDVKQPLIADSVSYSGGEEEILDFQ